MRINKKMNKSKNVKISILMNVQFLMRPPYEKYQRSDFDGYPNILSC